MLLRDFAHRPQVHRSLGFTVGKLQRPQRHLGGGGKGLAVGFERVHPWSFATDAHLLHVLARPDLRNMAHVLAEDLGLVDGVLEVMDEL